MAMNATSWLLSLGSQPIYWRQRIYHPAESFPSHESSKQLLPLLKLTHLTRTQILITVGVAVISFLLAQVFYRLCLSPIARFPGPKLAAASFWYEFYYDVINAGLYGQHIADLHKTYGPIIRINPYEIHINDPDAYASIYVESSQRKSHKWAFSVGGVDLPGTLPMTADHDLHRIRRNALNRFFSPRQVLRLEPVVREMLAKLQERLSLYKGTGKPVNMNHAFSALTGDIVTQYCFAHNYGVLDQPDFAPDWEDVAIRFSQLVHLFNQFPWLIGMMRKIPRRVMAMIDPRIIHFFNREDVLYNQISRIKKGTDMSKNEDQKTVFHDLIYESRLPAKETSVARLRDEGTGIVAAGTVTTGRALYLLTFYLLQNPAILHRLQEELRGPFANYPAVSPTWKDLEKLPFLTAVLQEALRLSYGAVHRLARVFPDYAFPYKDWIVPPNTPISFSACDMHENADIFSRPQVFDPERWLTTDPVELARHKANWWPFSKGSRNCAGISLAWAELYLTAGTLFREEGPQMELFETTEKDVLYERDFYAAFPALGTKGVRVLIK